MFENVVTLAVDGVVERLQSMIASEAAAIARIEAVYPMPELSEALELINQAAGKLKAAACRSMA